MADIGQVIVRGEFSRVDIDDAASVTVVERDVVSVVSAGIQGPPGASGAGFVHVQSSPAAEWIVNHNLGFRPAVAVTDTGGNAAIADVAHLSLNQLRIYFAAARAGEARCV